VETLEHLEEIGLNTHNQIQRPWSPIIKGGYWFKSRYIRLFGKWDSLWDNYIKSFKSVGISMGDSEEKIVCVWNKKSGNVTQKVLMILLSMLSFIMKVNGGIVIM